MNYEFPIIEHIDQVLPSIEGRDEFKVLRREKYTAIDYNYVLPDSFNDPIRRECRGIKFFPDGRIMARPFHKFFNIGERENTQPNLVDLSKPHKILKKLDGSMVHIVWIDGVPFFMTRAGVTHIHDLIMKEYDYSWIFHGDQENYSSYTSIYEYTSPNNRIVISYSKPQLTLLAVRENVSGKYINFKSTLEEISFSDTKSLMNYTKDLIGEEGYVVRFDDGHMVKIKADEYVLIHNTRSEFSHEKNVLRTILEFKSDDVLPLLPEDAQKAYKEYAKSVIDSLLSVGITLIEFLGETKSLNQKDYALRVMKEIDPRLQSVAFSMRKDEDAPIEILRLKILKGLSSQTKVDEWRDIIGAKWEWKGIENVEG